MRYFKSENATKPIKFKSGWTVKFEPCGFLGGAMVGVFSTENEGLAGELAGARGVTEISKEQYAVMLKKKLPPEGANTYIRSNLVQPTQGPLAPAAGKPKPSLEVEVVIDNPIRIGRIQ